MMFVISAIQFMKLELQFLEERYPIPKEQIKESANSAIKAGFFNLIESTPSTAYMIERPTIIRVTKNKVPLNAGGAALRRTLSF